MSDHQLLEAPRMADLVHDVKQRVVQRTDGRICNLEVELLADRIQVRGRAASFYLKQLAIQGALEAIHSCGNAPQVEIDVRITVKPATADCVEH